MAEPTVDPADLATYLGLDTVDADRASLLINQAMTLCRSIVDPIPETAEPVVLSVAARAYTNVTGVQREMVGGYQVAYAKPGVYLTRAERAALRRLSDNGGAFSVDLIANYDSRFQ